jgi:hypothetical protein
MAIAFSPRARSVMLRESGASSIRCGEKKSRRYGILDHPLSRMMTLCKLFG